MLSVRHIPCQVTWSGISRCHILTSSLSRRDTPCGRFKPMLLCRRGPRLKASASHYKSRLASIRDIVHDLMSSDEIANDSRVYNQLKAAEELSKTLTFVRMGGSSSNSLFAFFYLWTSLSILVMLTRFNAFLGVN
jgi:hypothetical protein